MSKRIPTPWHIVGMITAIPSIAFAALSAYDQLSSPDAVHDPEKVIQAIEESQRIQQTAEPGSIIEAREDINFQFTLRVEGTLVSRQLPGAKASRFTFVVHSEDECVSIPQLALSKLQHPSTVIIGTHRSAAILWQGGNDKAFCAATFQTREAATISIEFT